MVFEKIKEKFSKNDEKYEVLYYKYSKIKLENQKIKKDSLEEMKRFKLKLHEDMAKKLITIYEEVEVMKNDSFKVKSTDKDIQRLLMDVNKIEKKLKEEMKDYSIEEFPAQERFYDPEITRLPHIRIQKT